MTIEERVSRSSEIKARLAELDDQYRGEDIEGTEAAEEWADLNAEYDENERVCAQLIVRRDRVREISGSARGSRGRRHVLHERGEDASRTSTTCRRTARSRRTSSTCRS